MKLTKSKLKQIIKEESKKILSEDEDDWGGAAEYTPEQQKVVEVMESLIELIYNMEQSNPEMSDSYIQLFRALRSAGVNILTVAQMA